MKVTRLYSGTDGESHFEDIDIPLARFEPGEERSEFIKATGIIFRETSESQDLDWHNAPRRQYVFTLKGRGEIVVGDGTSRQFGPGDIMIADDLTGRGHMTRGVGNQPRISIFVTLD